MSTNRIRNIPLQSSVPPRPFHVRKTGETAFAIRKLIDEKKPVKITYKEKDPITNSLNGKTKTIENALLKNVYVTSRPGGISNKIELTIEHPTKGGTFYFVEGEGKRFHPQEIGELISITSTTPEDPSPVTERSLIPYSPILAILGARSNGIIRDSSSDKEINEAKPYYTLRNELEGLIGTPVDITITPLSNENNGKLGYGRKVMPGVVIEQVDVWQQNKLVNYVFLKIRKDGDSKDYLFIDGDKDFFSPLEGASGLLHTIKKSDSKTKSLSEELGSSLPLDIQKRRLKDFAGEKVELAYKLLEDTSTQTTVRGEVKKVDFDEYHSMTGDFIVVRLDIGKEHLYLASRYPHKNFHNFDLDIDGYFQSIRVLS